jgi:hypothetical protein
MVCNLWFIFLVSFSIHALQKGDYTMQCAASHSLTRFPAAPSDLAGRTQPFRDAEEAWLWTMAALVARREGARYSANKGAVSRPCEPDDVVKCLDALYRQRRIDLAHARILRVWGERRVAPNPAYSSENGDWRLWREAMDRLEWPLRIKGIVA